MKKTLSILVAGLAVIQVSCLAGATSTPLVQDAGGQTLKQAQDAKNYMLWQRQAERSQEPTVISQLPSTADQVVSAKTVKLLVRSIVTNDSAILSPAELRQLTGISQPREMTLADLYAIAGNINKLYQQKGYPASQAVIPKQYIKDGVVHLQLVEGRYGRFILKDRKQWSERYILNQLMVKKGDLVNAKKLELALLNFNANNSAKLQADLAAGESFGLTDCIITVREPKQFSGSVFVDNTNPDTSGQYRLGVQLLDTNLGGSGERLLVSPIFSRGTVSGILSFDAPVGIGGTRIRAGANRSHVRIINGRYDSLGIRGNSSDIYLGVTSPLVQTYHSDLQLFADYHRKKSYTTVSSSERLYDTDTNVYDGGLTYHSYSRYGAWYGQLGGSLIHTDNKLAATDGGRNLSRYNLDLIRQQMLGSSQLLTFRFSGQLTSDKNLPLTEQLTLGGMYSMRGFPDSYVSGDSGFYSSLEYEFPLITRWSLRGLAFLDYGQVLNRYTDISLRRKLMSSGLGISYNRNGLYARLIWGVPMVAAGEVEKGHPRLHFYLQHGI